MMTTRAKFKKMENNIKPMVGSSDDLLIEILRRLPAKSIIRFKSVSKHWQVLLSQRHFTLLFDKLLICQGFFCRGLYISFDVENQSPKPFHSLNFYRERPGIRIIQSCNGLLLCCSNKWPQYTSTTYVFNPTTKQYGVIPPPIENHNIRTRFLGLAFHHTDCVHYKVVCIYHHVDAFFKENSDKKLYQIQIYSSDTGKWRNLPKYFPMFLSRFDSTNAVYCNGAIYWALNRNLFYFILDSEHLQKLPLPYYGVTNNYYGPFNITESRGQLHLLETTAHKVYEMLSNRSGWVLKYQVDDRQLRAVSGMVRNNKYNYFEILDVVRGEKEEDTFMLVGIFGNLMKYNIQDKSLKLLFNLEGTILYYELKVYRYIESIGSFEHLQDNILGSVKGLGNSSM